MVIEFKCPHCHARTSVDESHAGQSRTCAFCKTVVTVPQADPESGTGRFEESKKIKLPVDVGCGCLVLIIGGLFLVWVAFSPIGQFLMGIFG